MRRLSAVLLVLALLSLAAPAFAAGALGLSWDGATWATQLDGTLFNRPGSIHAWVPGDSDTEHFYLRDQGGDAARLTLEYDLPPNSLVNATDFEVTASLDGGTPLTLTPGATWLPVGGTTLANGGVADVAVTATFRWGSTNQSMTDAFPLTFRATLTEDVGGPGSDVTPAAIATPAASAGPGGAGSHPGAAPGAGQGKTSGAGPGEDRGTLLPGTGAPEVRWAVTLGLLCLGGGIAIVVLARRRDRDAGAS